MDPAPPAVTQKAVLRAQLLAGRAQRTSTARQDAGEALADAVRPLVAAGATVAAYAAVGTEPPTAPLLEALHGVRVLLPVLRPDGDLDWALWTGELTDGPRGTRQPLGPPLGVGAVAGCDLVVVPALAVDRRGVRLGRGGGSYDRALRRARGLVVALLHDGELIDRVPEAPHDVHVGAAATPSTGVVRLPDTMGT